MLKRLGIYLQEMYPIIPRLSLALVYFFQIYFLLLLNMGEYAYDLGIQEATGVFTVFSFLLSLRIADDLKDYETDKRLFPARALPSGRVKKHDLSILLAVNIGAATLLNWVYMNNFGWYLVLFIYGTLMSLWFFNRETIQNSLPVAFVTHNPVVIILNAYIISFVCYKYNLPLISVTSVLLLLSLYFPSLIWEISRKIRAPKDETDYVTYSKLFGYDKSARFVQIISLIDMVINIILLWNVAKLGAALLVLIVIWMTVQFHRYINNPDRFNISRKVEIYIFMTETTIVVSVIAHILMR